MKKLACLITAAIAALSVAALYAAGAHTPPSATYLVYRQAYFPQDRYRINETPELYRAFAQSGRTLPDETGGQPFKQTEYTINYNGKYALWTVTPSDEEIPVIASMTNAGQLLKLSEMRLELQTGGGEEIRRLETVTLANLPTDYYEVLVSTAGN